MKSANIAIDVLKMESEGIKAVKEGLLLAEKAAKAARTSSAISDSRNMMMMDNDLKESC